MNITEAYAILNALQYKRHSRPVQSRADSRVTHTLLVHCGDPRINERHELHLAEPESQLVVSIGAALQDGSPDNPLGAHTRANLGLLSDLNPNLKHIVIMGHTDCKALQDLTHTLLDPTYHSAASEWLVPMAPEGLRKALVKAKKSGTTEAEMQPLVEQVMVLQTMHNVYDYYLHDSATRARLDAGELRVVGAFRDVNSREIFAFDGDKKAFRALHDIHGEFGGQIAKLSKTSSSKTVFKPGAVSETVAEVKLTQIDSGIAERLAAISGLKGVGA